MAKSDLPKSRARSYHSPLRRRQSEQTRELILEALAGAVTREGLDRVALAEVAEQAGVAERTLYRHFPNRQALIEGLGEWLDRRIEELIGRIVIERPEDIPANIPRVYRAFEEIGTLAEAAVIAALASRTPTELRSRRTELFRTVLADELAHLDPASAAAAFAALRHLVSSTTWFVLREEHQLRGERAGEAVAWVVRLMLRDLQAGGGPAVAGDGEGVSAG